MRAQPIVLYPVNFVHILNTKLSPSINRIGDRVVAARGTRRSMMPIEQLEACHAKLCDSSPPLD